MKKKKGSGVTQNKPDGPQSGELCKTVTLTKRERERERGRGRDGRTGEDEEREGWTRQSRGGRGDEQRAKRAEDVGRVEEAHNIHFKASLFIMHDGGGKAKLED
ncbi:hypothetical protein EYF80_016044 [Liparis tanakae]|uniref:Uncharacterized protein n=1 Tax=Liparis tanakae TaxID=230148 RepID=A0A4Z2I8H7_9TELE|nr:hypothetical protein EYF80_016044 [Liparis tanakae]